MSGLGRHKPKTVAFAVSLVCGVAACIDEARATERWEYPLRAVDAAEKLLNDAAPPHPQDRAIRSAIDVIRGAAALDGLGHLDGRAHTDALELLTAIGVLVDGPNDAQRSTPWRPVVIDRNEVP